MTRTWMAVAIALVGPSCSDGTAPPPEIRPTEELNFLRPAPGAPPFAETTVSFIATRGEDSEVRIRYQVAPGQFEEFVRFRVRDESLLAYPDGRPFRDGDQIEITLRIIDLERLIVDMQPSGLTFSSREPAELKFKFNHTHPDRDGDGDVDAADAEIESKLSIWKQEAANQPWVKLSSRIEFELDEIEADITGFTGYAFAY